MDHEFWLSRWRDERIGFHESTVNPLLVDYLASLELVAPSRLFVPLCGKSLDLGWLRAQGHSVVGIELAESAVRAVFEALRETPDVTDLGALKRYRGEAIELFVGDFFDLSAEQLGPIDAVYDRAALIALPMPMRAHYASRLVTLCASAPQLLITLDYDQTEIEGPPFSVG
ncbi:MAG: thiopurine S-methyltransferase, partial [Pseudomonadota bacterium]